MKGVQRVATFCLLIAVLPVILLAIPLYLRHSLYKDVTYIVSESDILEMINGISSVFCEGHSLNMDAPFSAFQIKGPPEMSVKHRKHIQLKKKMTLQDDTLEYWGFYLPNKSTVNLSVCSRFPGSRILVVKGEKELRNCGLMKADEISPTMIADNEGGDLMVIMEGGVTPSPEQLKEDYDNNAGEDTADEPEEEEDPFPSSKEERKRRLIEDLSDRRRRSPAEILLDGGVAHGGVEPATGHRLNDSSASSFESTLLTCYDGSILLSRDFPPSADCISINYLNTVRHLSTAHNVTTDGYYFYIFYSDNDFVSNEIYAVFDIYKPTFLFSNHTKSCINVTSCTFDVPFYSDEIVIIEIPTRNGIGHEADDNHVLISSCHPRTVIYAIFPIAVLLLILSCAFI